MKDPILEAKLALNERSQQLASKYSKDPKQAGFKLVKVTPRGVYFKGNLASFEKTFQAISPAFFAFL